jgi:uncharacterized protein YjiS (DUF1127 family)
MHASPGLRCAAALSEQEAAMTLYVARRAKLLARPAHSIDWPRLIGAMAATLLQAVGRAVVAVKNRRELARMADLDDRLLADIGLTRSDLHDAHSAPFIQDPTSVLKRHSDLGVLTQPSLGDWYGTVHECCAA